MFANIVGTMQHVRSGRARAVAVSSAARSPMLPEVPSVAETYQGFDIPTWSGIFVPTGVPRNIVAKLNGDMVKILQRSDVKERFSNQGSESTPSTPEALAEHVRKETLMYANVIKAVKSPQNKLIKYQ